MRTLDSGIGTFPLRSPSDPESSPGLEVPPQERRPLHPDMFLPQKTTTPAPDDLRHTHSDHAGDLTHLPELAGSGEFMSIFPSNRLSTRCQRCWFRRCFFVSVDRKSACLEETFGLWAEPVCHMSVLFGLMPVFLCPRAGALSVATEDTGRDAGTAMQNVAAVGT